MKKNNVISTLFDLKINDDFGIDINRNKDMKVKEANKIYNEKAKELEDYIEIKIPYEVKSELKQIIEEYTSALHDVNFEENRAYYIIGYKEGAEHIMDILK